jgi:spore coat polysaccharide biosynthesis protein SpsF
MDRSTDRISAIIEARMGSTRLPGKVLKPLAGVPMLQHIIDRVRRSTYIDSIIIATTTRNADDLLYDFASDMNIYCFRGSEDDVLGRVASTIRKFRPDIVVNLTGDNPLVDASLIDDMIDFFYEGDYDYVTNTYMYQTNLWDAEKTFPFGLGIQIFRSRVMLEVDEEIKDMNMREHATFGIYHRTDNRYKLGAFQAEGKYSGWRYPDLRLTVDTVEDYELVNRIFEELYPMDNGFSTLNAIKLLINNPHLSSINAEVKQKIAYKNI